MKRFVEGKDRRQGVVQQRTGNVAGEDRGNQEGFAPRRQRGGLTVRVFLDQGLTGFDCLERQWFTSSR